MAVTEAPQWQPATPEEQALADAFSNLNSSNDKVVIPGEGDKPNRFILHTRGYWDLRAYVLTGKEFPKSNAEFESKMPKTAFAKLTDIDTTIYEKTQKCMVLIGETCDEYHKTQLSKLVTAATTAAQYSDNALSLLMVAEGINLRHQLDILLDPKYTDKSHEDQAFTDAREAAQMTLTILKDDALQKEAEVKEIAEHMMTFKDNTAKILADVEYLTRQYKTGEVVNEKGIKTPYLTYLNEKLQQDINKTNDAIKKANKKYEEWDKAAAMAIGFAPFGIIGLVVMGIKAAQAVELRQAYNNLLATVEASKKERLEETTLIGFVNQLIDKFEDIDGKMTAAINAMVELHQLFNAQAGCYDKIALNMNGMSVGTSSDSAVNRKLFIQWNMTKAIEKLNELKDLASEFAQSIIQEIHIS